MLNQIAAIHGTGTPVSTTSYESIATATVGAGGTSTIEFTSIASTWKHLQIRAFAPSGSYATLRFNNDTTTSNYRYHYILGTGASASAGTAQNAYFPTAGSWSQPYGAVVDILDYGSTSKNKTIRTLEGFDANGSGEIYLTSNLWMNSSNAITSIKIIAQGSVFGQYSSFALYGIKG